MSLFVFFCCLFIVNASGSITSVGEERVNLSAVVYFSVIMWFLIGEVSSFSGCLGWATLLCPQL